MSRIILFCSLLFFFSSCSTALTVAQDSPTEKLDRSTFEKLHTELTSRKETWKTIPWQTNLLEAQKLAAQQKKPMFIWSMDGHPLGCT